MSDDIQKKLDELVKQSDLFISSPETIKRLKSRGLPYQIRLYYLQRISRRTIYRKTENS